MAQPSNTTVVETPEGAVQIGHFAEVLSLGGRYLNDHCLLRSDALWHLFGIVGQVAPGSKPLGTGVEVAFAHAVSRNLYHWDVCPDVMECTGEWPENKSVFAPYVAERDGRFYILYAAADRQGTQRICLATSGDLFNWQRYAGNPVIVPSVSWSRWPGFGLDSPVDHPDPRLRGTYGGCRDPHVLRLESGLYVAYWVSRLQEKFGRDLTCVAASMSDDLVHWQEIGPVFALRAWHDPPSREVESPCVISKDGRYWLFFKHGWWTHYVVSESPYDFTGGQPIRLGYCHAAEVFYWEQQWWITHCSGDPTDYAYRRTNRTRGLYLGRLAWPQDGHPRLL